MGFTSDDITQYAIDNNLIRVNVTDMRQAITDYNNNKPTPYKDILDILTQYQLKSIFSSKNRLWFLRDKEFYAVYYKLRDLKYPTWDCFPSSFSDCETIIKTYIAVINNYPIEKTFSIGTDMWERFMNKKIELRRLRINNILNED